jgi:hypothetical protein
LKGLSILSVGQASATEGTMSEKKYIVRLSDDERIHLKELLRKGIIPARRLQKAQILLKADASEGGEGWSDA